MPPRSLSETRRLREYQRLAAGPERQEAQGYGSLGDPQAILNSPEFLQDLRDYYRDRGVSGVDYDTRDALLRRFFRDGVWRQANTVSAIGSAIEAHSGSEEQRGRMARIEQASRAMPNFWQDGGRGAEGVGDTLAAIALDPTNLIGGVAARGAAQVGARGAALAGSRQATRSGLLRGLGAAAATEGAIGAGQEAIVDTALQTRDVNLGLQDEFDRGRLASSTALGGLMGGAIGGAIGVPGAISGARSGVRQAQNAVRLGIDPADAARMSNEQFRALDGVSGLIPAPSDAPPAPDIAPDIDPGGNPITDPGMNVDFDQATARINAQMAELRSEIDARASEGADYEPLVRARARLRQLRQIGERLRLEDEQIGQLARTNDEAALAQANRRSVALESDLAAFHAALNMPDGADIEMLYSRVMGRPVEAPGTPDAPAPAEPAATRAATAATAPGTPTPAAPAEAAAAREAAAPQEVDGAPLDVEPEADLPPDPETDAIPNEPQGEQDPPLASASAQSLAEREGIDLASITGTGRNGKITYRDVRAAMSERASQPAPVAEAPVTPDMPDAPDAPGTETAQAENTSDPDRIARFLAGEGDDGQVALQEFVSIADTIGDDHDLSADEVIALFRLLGQNTSYRTDADDLVRMIEFGIGMDPDAFENSMGNPFEPVTTTERKKLRAFIEAERAQNPDLPEDAIRSLAYMRLKVGGVVEGENARGLTSDPERARLWTSAGRSKATGRIQGILRSGQKIATGSDYTITDGPAPRESGFNQEEVAARVATDRARRVQDTDPKGNLLEDEDGKPIMRSAYVGDGIEPFRATGATRVLGVKGGRVSSGTTVFLDVDANKVYASRENALAARGQGRSTPIKVVPPEDASGRAMRTAALRKILTDFADDPAGALAAFSRLNSGRKKLATATAVEVTPDIISRQNSVPIPDGELLLIRRKSDGVTRLQSPKQKADGIGFAGVAGSKTPDPADWEIRTVPESAYTSSPAQVRSMWDGGVDGASPAKTREPIKLEPLAGSDGKRASQPLTADEARALSEVSKLASGPRYNAGDTPAMADVYQLWAKLHSAEINEAARWTGEDIARMSLTLEGVFEKIAPNGYLRDNVERTASIASLKKTISDLSASERAEAIKAIERLATDDAGLLPRFESTSGTPAFARKFGGHGSVVRLNPSERRAEAPFLRQFYHELAHWSYFNALTPADRAEFWRGADKYLANQATTAAGLPAEGVPLANALPVRDDILQQGMREAGFEGKVNAGRFNSPQELFAEQFVTWAMREAPDSLLNDESYWKRIAYYVKAIFDRFIGKSDAGDLVDPDLVPLFKRIFPDENASRAERKGVIPTDAADAPIVAPNTPTGEALYRRLASLDMIQDDIEGAMLTGSPSGIVEAFISYQQELLSLAPRGNAGGTGTLEAIKKHRRYVYQRIKAIDEIMRGRPLTDAEERFDAARYAEAGITDAGKIANQEDVAQRLTEYYWKGYGAFEPENGRPKGIDERSIGRSGGYHLFDILRRDMLAGFVAFEDGLPDLPVRSRPDIAPEETFVQDMEAATRRIWQMRKRRARTDAATTAQATTEAATPPAKRKRRTRKKALEEGPRTGSLREKPMSEVLDEYRKHRGTTRGDTAASVIVEKNLARAQSFDPANAVAEDYALKTVELRTMFADALAENDGEAITRYGSELARRGEKRAAKKASRQTRDLIAKEKLDHIGVEEDEGIPQYARATLREVLSYITHRDPTVQRASRRMTYRLFNMLGRTASATMANANLMSAADLVRIAGQDPTRATGVAMDFRSDAFKAMRSDMRRISVGLTKGSSTPQEVMHEIAHVLVRSRAIPGAQVDAITDAFRSADDAVKARVMSDYGGKYTNHSAAVREELIAEEWFAEKFVEYLSERLDRTGFTREVLAGVDPSIKTQVLMALDTLIERVAYFVNGLVKRDSIRQTFRRITFYGDMFETTGSPVRAPNRIAFHPSEASDAADTIIRGSTEGVKAARNDFVSGGAGARADGRYDVYYHGTPQGDVFTDPAAVLEPSTTGNYGPGTYITKSPAVASEVYADRPTARAMMRRFQERMKGASDAERRSMQVLSEQISQTRESLSSLRLEHTEINTSIADATEESRPTLIERRDFLREEIRFLSEIEESQAAQLRDMGLEFSPDVIPVVVRITTPFDARPSKSYAPTDEGIWGIFDSAVAQAGVDQAEAGERLGTTLYTRAAANGGMVNGRDTYRAMVSALTHLIDDQEEAQSLITEAMRGQGYDGIQTVHHNSLGITGSDFDVARVAHETLVAFAPEQVKHINASQFDSGSPALRANVRNEIPRGITGTLSLGLIDGQADRIQDIANGSLTEALEAAGVSNELGSVVSTLSKGRVPSEAEIETGRRLAPFGFLQETSKRMERMGFSWPAEWYKTTFVERQNDFARKFFPLARALSELPDSRGGLRRWFDSVTMQSVAKQPDSHGRILKALRYGDESRHAALLNEQERNIYSRFREAFKAEREELVRAGVLVGNRQNYVPQVWDKTAIQKNRAEFEQAMADYYQAERLNAGERSAPEEEAQAFARNMYARLAGDDSDGVWVGDSKPQATGLRDDSIDYSRVIELEKHPEMMKALEPFLVNDLEFLITKYFDGTSRRLSNVRKMGVNNHAFYDYMMVADQGVDGIARLLSTQKVFRRGGFVRDGSAMEAFEITREMRVPFAGDEQSARSFAENLVGQYKASGGNIAAARAKIEGAMAGVGMSQDFERRMEAILGALKDFKGQPKPYGEVSDFDFAEDALRLAMKHPIGNSNKYMRQASITMRSINNVSLLGFTTLSSLGDVALPIIRSGSLSSWAKGMANFAKDPEYRRMINDVGVAIENITHERMIGMYGATDGKASIAFFNATGLTPWTDFQRKLAGATGFEAFKTMQRKALREWRRGLPIGEQTREYRLASRFLKRYGLGDFLPDGPRAGETLESAKLLEEDRAIGQAIIQFADESIFQPNPNDVPMWAQTPLGAIVFQLKSFPLMMSRMTGYVVEELMQGNYKPALYLATFGVGMGAASVAVKDIIQGRGGDENRSHELRRRNLLKALGYDEEVHGNEQTFLGWYFDGLLQMGGLGLYGDVLYGIVDQAENGAYGKTRITSLLAGPSVGLGYSAVDIGAGAADMAFGGDNGNAKERTMYRELFTRVPIAGGVRSLRENVVDTLGGLGGRQPSGQDDARGAGMRNSGVRESGVRESGVRE